MLFDPFQTALDFARGDKGVSGSRIRPSLATPECPLASQGQQAPVEVPGDRVGRTAHRIRSRDLGWAARKSRLRTKVLKQKEKRRESPAPVAGDLRRILQNHSSAQVLNFAGDVIGSDATALTMKEEDQFHEQCGRVWFLGREVTRCLQRSSVPRSSRAAMRF